jgi:hypothetical protein
VGAVVTCRGKQDLDVVHSLGVSLGRVLTLMVEAELHPEYIIT